MHTNHQYLVNNSKYFNVQCIYTCALPSLHYKLVSLVMMAGKKTDSLSKVALQYFEYYRQ